MSSNTACFRIADAEESVSAADIHHEDLLTVEQLAQRMQVDVSWVYDQTRSRAGTRNGNDNVLPHLRLGQRKGLRFYWPDVVRWLERRQHNHVSTTRKEHRA
jgi:hypothetical protein